jgi:hypothetical protein
LLQKYVKVGNGYKKELKKAEINGIETHATANGIAIEIDIPAHT